MGALEPDGGRGGLGLGGPESANTAEDLDVLTELFLRSKRRDEEASRGKRPATVRSGASGLGCRRLLQGSATSPTLQDGLPPALAGTRRSARTLTIRTELLAKGCRRSQSLMKLCGQQPLIRSYCVLHRSGKLEALLQGSAHA